MIATHNIKVNEQWYKAGEEYEVEEPRQETVKEEQIQTEAVPDEPAPVEEAPKAEPKPRTTVSRRKKVSE